MSVESNGLQQEIEERYRAILDNIHDGYYEVDMVGNHTFVNNAICKMFNYPEEELLSMNFRDYVDEETAAKVYEVYRRVFRTGEPVGEFEFEAIRKDGERRMLQTSVSLARNAKGRRIGFRGILRDITFQKEAEQLLTEAKDQLAHRVDERTAELAEANQELEQRIIELTAAEEEIRQSQQSQGVLNALLQLSLQELSLQQQLDRAFDLLLSTPWLSTLPKGSIFLVEDEPEVLVLKVQRGLAEPLLTKCARVPFGECLCGEAALKGETIHAPCLDDRHVISYDGMADHGHYNIPIVLDGQVSGIINLYLQKDHQSSVHEVSFLESVANTLAALIKRRRLEEKLQGVLEHRGRQVQLSTQVAQEISTATDLNDLYQRVVAQVKEQFDYYHTQLYRCDAALDAAVLVFGYGEIGEQMKDARHSVPFGSGSVGAVAVTGKSLLRANYEEVPGWKAEPLLPDTKGQLAVPIKLGDEIWGVLDVRSDIANGLTEEDQLLLEGLCGQISVAIDSTRLRQDMEARLRELNTLHRYMSREGWETYEASSQKVLGYQFDHAGVQQYNPGALSNGAPKTVSMESPGADGAIAEAKIKVDDVVVTPLTARGATFGRLGVANDLDSPLSEEDRAFLNAISEQVAEAMESARLFEQTQKSLAEQERLTSEMETVAQVSTAASTALDTDTLLQTVVDLAKDSFGLYHVHVYLLDEVAQKLVLRAGAGSVGRLMVLEGREIAIDAKSLVARAARERQGFFENDVYSVADFLPHPLLPKTKAEMALPIMVGDSLLGVFDLQADETDYFTVEQMQIQKTLAAQIAVAVQNAFLYAEQVEASAKLREVDQLKSEFLASMSHELRTPLNSIIGFADIILEGIDGELNERMEEDVKLIRGSGAHLRDLIGDILDMSKIEAGRMELRYEDLDVRQLGNDVLATAGPLAKEKSLSLRLNVADDVTLIEADRTRLRQILLNIMGNAIKFTQEGSVTLGMRNSEDKLLFSIRDTGIGIKPESISVVFEQFRQVDGSLNRKVGGTGLGMPITKNLVELHGGKIWVDSVFGQGSTFWFTIPRARPSRKGTSPLGDTGSLG